MKASILSFALLVQLAPVMSQSSDVEADITVSANAILLESMGTDPDPASAFTKDVDPSLIRSEEGLVIWPIPAGSELNIYCSSETSGNLPFEIVDMTGRTIVRGSIQGEKPNMIEVNHLKKGDHLLRVVDGSGVRSIAFQSLGE